jgi:hypothetical protein
MKGSRIAAVATALALAAALSGGAALAATSHSHPAATRVAQRGPHSKPPGRTVLITCMNRGVVRPYFFMLACGDGTAYLTKLRWATWTTSLASGTGRFSLNPCTPSCARGRFITRPVVLVLWHTAVVPHRQGRRQFMSMTIIYTGKRPAGSAPSVNESLWHPTAR